VNIYPFTFRGHLLLISAHFLMNLGDFVMLDAPSQELQQLLQAKEGIFINLGFSSIPSVEWLTYLS